MAVNEETSSNQAFQDLLREQTTIFQNLSTQFANIHNPSIAFPQNVPPPPQLDVNGDLEKNLDFFQENWVNYCKATGMDGWPDSQNERKVSILLSFIGTAAMKKYMNFELTAEDKRNVTSVLKAIREKIVVKRNLIVDRMEFFSINQNMDEPFNDYLIRLKNIARTCKFGALEEEFITFKIVTACKWLNLRTKMISISDIDLNKAIDMCRMEEISEKYNPGEAKVQTVKSNKYKKCNFCGKNHPFTKGACSAWGHKCKLCNRRNHYETVCKKKSIKNTEEKIKNKKIREIHNTTGTEDESEESSDSSNYEGEIKKILDNSEHGGNVLAELELKLNNKWRKIKCDLDTGAQISVIGYKYYCKLVNKSNPKLSPSCYKLKNYDKSTIPVLGEVKIPCRRNNHKYLLVFQVVEVDSKAVLSANVCKTLGFVKFCNSVTIKSNGESGNLDKDELLKIHRAEAMNIINKYADVFEGYGNVPGEVNLEVDEKIKPVIQTPRRIPVKFRESLKKELEHLEKNKIIQKIEEHTDWVSNILLVQKKNSFRICLDPIPLNKALKRPRLQFTTLDEILPELGKAKVFSVVDAKKGFWQLKLNERSSRLTTFWTPFGRYRWLRLPFGVSPAPELFQLKLREILHGLPGIEAIADDIIIFGYGETLQDALKVHNQNLEKLLNLLNQHNFKLNKSKLELCKRSIKFYGHYLTDDGLKPDMDKIKTITKFPTPKDKKELHTFIGMITYLSRYIPNLSLNSHILRNRIHCQSPWAWTNKEEEEFQRLKKIISHIDTLKYYDPNKPVTIECDASSFGLGVAIFQEQGILGYASRTLTKTESNYAQIEKELLAIVFACSRFDQLIVGNSHTIIKTDHKPLINIFNKPLLKIPKRLQHMRMQLQRYNIELQFVSGKENIIADAISRNPLPDSELNDEFKKSNIYKIFKYISNIKLQDQLQISEERLIHIREETTNDEVFQKLIKYIQHSWPKSYGATSDDLKVYYKFKDELSTQDGLIFRGDQILIPHRLRSTMIDKVHTSHNGIEATIRLARQNIFWPGMSTEIKNRVQSCEICSKYQPSQQNPPMQSHKIPEYPFQIVSMDVFFVNYKSKPTKFLITVDHYSDFFELNIIKDLSATTVINCCKQNFSRFGIPQIVCTDNGTNFVNHDMVMFAKEWEFHHSTSSPHHQQGNGKAESAVKIAKRLIKKSEDAKEDLWYSLLNWRNIPNHMDSSPALRLLARETRHGVPSTIEKLKPKVVDEVSEKIERKRRMNKNYYDKKTRILPTLEEGQHVSVQVNPEISKEWMNGFVKEKLNDRSYIVNVNGADYRRNLVNIKPSLVLLNHKVNENSSPSPSPKLDVKSTFENTDSYVPVDESHEPVIINEDTPLIQNKHPLNKELTSAKKSATPKKLLNPEKPVPIESKESRPKRNIKLPARLRDFVLDKREDVI